MKNKKIFGIGAVVLMILVAFAPIINGMQLNSEKELNVYVMGNGDHDLELKQNLIFVKFKARPVEGLKGNNDYVEYNLNYIITNVGTGTFSSRTVSLTLSTKNGILDEFPVVVPDLGPGQSTYDNKEYSLISSENLNTDEEIKVAGKTVKLEFSEPYDNNPDNDYFYYFTKFWSEDISVKPTATQVLVAHPEIIEWEEIGGISFPDFLDVRILKNIFHSNRLGYIGEASVYLKEIAICLSAIGTVIIGYIIDIAPEAGVLINWIVDCVTAVIAAANGVINPGTFGDLFKRFFEEVLPAIKEIITKAIAAGVVLLTEFYKLEKISDDFYNWSLTDPWFKPITIEGEVARIKNNEVVTVKCRGGTTEVRDPSGDGKGEYWLEATSDPISPEKSSFGLHRCVTTVSGNMHTGQVQSIPVLSYAFSNGSLRWDFTTLGDSNNRDCNLRQSFFGKLMDLINNRTLFTILERLLGNVKTLPSVN